MYIKIHQKNKNSIFIFTSGSVSLLSIIRSAVTRLISPDIGPPYGEIHKASRSDIRDLSIFIYVSSSILH